MRISDTLLAEAYSPPEIARKRVAAEAPGFDFVELAPPGRPIGGESAFATCTRHRSGGIIGYL